MKKLLFCLNNFGIHLTSFPFINQINLKTSEIKFVTKITHYTKIHERQGC